MKKWYKIIVRDAEGWDEGEEIIKAESEQEAISEIVENWERYPYCDDPEDYTMTTTWLSLDDEAKCAHADEVERFMADGCTRSEAERHIKNGSEAVKVSDWEQYTKDNDLRDEDGELITLDKVKTELDASSVTVDDEEYILIYVL